MTTHSNPSTQVGLDGRPWIRALAVLTAGSLLLGAFAAALQHAASPNTSGFVPSVAHRPSALRAPAIPSALAAAASSAIGAHNSSYAITRDGGALRATGGGISSTFTSAGLTLRSPRGVAQLALESVGRGDSRAAPGLATPVAHGNTVAYRRGPLEAWYRNGPLGLEQGFTLSRAPAPSNRQPLTITLATRGALAREPASGGITFTSTGGHPFLRYGALSAHDATGRVLRSSIAAHGSTITLRVSDRSARYPVTIDPFVSQAKLAAPTSGAGASIGAPLLGWSVAISANGTTALVGGPTNNTGEGAAWVFIRKHGEWIDQHEITVSTTSHGKPLCTTFYVGAELGFGGAVALSANGNTALISCPDYNGDEGSAWVFIRKHGEWIDQHHLAAPEEGPYGHAVFGASVALASNGDTALIGAPAYGRSQGAAWVFIRKGTTWVNQHMISAPSTGVPGAGEKGFGGAVALSANGGNTALIGASGSIENPGWAWVFVRKNRKWTNQHEIEDPDRALDEEGFGESVALSANGNTALIGNPYDARKKVGAAWVFTRASRAWSEQAKLVAPTGGSEAEVGGGFFGSSVALDSGGQAAFIGGVGDSGGAGAVWNFVYQPPFLAQPGEWQTAQKLEAPAGTRFGTSIALSEEGNTVLIGDPKDNSGHGFAWVYGVKETVIK